MSLAPDEYLVTHKSLFSAQEKDKPVLDLACGNGRNGLYLAGRGQHVLLADRNALRLQECNKTALSMGLQNNITCIQADFEEHGLPFMSDCFETILVFRYLHRALFPEIRRVLRAGGRIVYSTFTEQQAAIGKPSNPDYLLEPNELPTFFEDFTILEHEEGYFQTSSAWMARLIAIAPTD